MIALTAGHLTRDRYPEGFVPGGGVWYVSHGWRAMAGTVEARAVIAAAPADVPPVWPGAVAVQGCPLTTTFHNTYDATGRTMRLEAQAPPLRADAVPPGWQRCDALLLAPVAGELDPAAWLTAIDARVTGAGLQGWLKQRVGETFRADPAGFDVRRLRGLDVAFLSDEDYGGDRGWLAGLRAVVPRVLLTHGARGCTIFDGEAVIEVPVEPVAEVDPTGAGDTFAAGTLIALADGMAPAEAAGVGARLAARCVQVRGPAR